MADSPILPGPRAWRDGAGKPLPVEFYQFLRDLVRFVSQTTGNTDSLASILARVAALEDAPSLDAEIIGPSSVAVFGTLADGSVVVQFANDSVAPGNTYRYGTGPAGAKGWLAVADDFLAGTGIELTPGTDGVLTIALDAASIASLLLADTAVQSVVAGTNVTVDNTDPQNPIISASGGGGGISDGDKGDITVSGAGTVWTIDAGVVDTAKLGGDITSAGKAILDDVDATAQRATLGLGTAATQASTAFEAAFSKGDLIAGANVTLSGTLTGRLVGTGNVTIDAAGGSAPPLLPADYYGDYYFLHTNAVAGPWIGAAVASGTNTTAIPVASMDGLFPFGVFLRSSTTANGGWRYSAASLIGAYFGSGDHKFQCAFKWQTSFTGRTVRMGMLDTTTSGDSTDGAYFEVLADIVSAKTANNSTRTTNPTTYTLSLNTTYTFDIEVEANGASARFRIYDTNNPTPVYDETNTTNIPTTTARSFGVGIVATEVSTTASDIGVLYRMGYGNVAGFNRARG